MEELLLVLRGTPAAIDVELDPVACGISCSLAQGTEESWIEVGYTRDLVVEDRCAVGDGTVSLAKRTKAPTSEDVDGWCRRRGRGIRRGRGRRPLMAEGGDRRYYDEQAGDPRPANPDPTG